MKHSCFVQERYKEVKARNGQLLKMLQQGESKCRTANTPDRLKSCIYSYLYNMYLYSVKDKAEILLQVEELLNIKEELSSQVCV